MIARPSRTCVRARLRAHAAANFANFQLEQPSGSGASVEELATAGRRVAKRTRSTSRDSLPWTPCSLTSSRYFFFDPLLLPLPLLPPVLFELALEPDELFLVPLALPPDFWAMTLFLLECDQEPASRRNGS
jgi:hypothetical protein